MTSQVGTIEVRVGQFFGPSIFGPQIFTQIFLPKILFGENSCWTQKFLSLIFGHTVFQDK